jgi:DNA polymerase V
MTKLYSSVYAGSPQPSDDWQDFDLASHLVSKPADTFYVRVQGDSMAGTGIFDGDILIVDRSREAKQSDVVVAQVEDGYTVKRFQREQGRLRLVSDKGTPIECGEDVRICGVATFAIHRL